MAPAMYLALRRPDAILGMAQIGLCSWPADVHEEKISEWFEEQICAFREFAKGIGSVPGFGWFLQYDFRCVLIIRPNCTNACEV